jgi:hypothetical protein
MLFDAIAQLNQKYAKQTATKPLAKKSKHRTLEGIKPTNTINPTKTKKARQIQLQYNNLTTLGRRGQFKKMVDKPAK